MSKAYPLELRQQIITLYQEGNISQRQLARQFGVTLSFVQKLLKQYRETGNIAPKVRTKQTPSKLTPEQRQILADIFAKHQDATLEELRHLLNAKTGVLISLTTMHRMLKRYRSNN